MNEEFYVRDLHFGRMLDLEKVLALSDEDFLNFYNKEMNTYKERD